MEGCKLQDARRVAVDILMKLEQQRSNSTQLLQNTLAGVEDSRERKLATELVLGVLRWRGWLLFLIGKVSKPPGKKLDLPVRVILMLGAYQLLYTRIRPHAVIHETVKLCRSARVVSAAGFVNAVLRNLQRNLASLPQPQGSEMETLSVVHSHPEWLVRRWVERYGIESATNILVTNNHPPPVHLRVNTLRFDAASVRARLEAEGVRVEPTTFGPEVFAVRSGAPQRTHVFKEGGFYIQDPASEILGAAAGSLVGKRVLDVAAAPGGKTVQFAVRMNGEGSIVCIDSSLGRMQRWRENIDRLGIRFAHPVVADGRRLPLLQKFDLVAVDAPCSSLGVIRRHPEIKWWLRPEDLAGFQDVQLQILESCANNVRDNGEMIYSVCSFEPEETIEIKERFLAAHPEFAEVQSLTLLPHVHGTDGFYIAKFRKKILNTEDTETPR